MAFFPSKAIDRLQPQKVHTAQRIAHQKGVLASGSARSHHAVAGKGGYGRPSAMRHTRAV